MLLTLHKVALIEFSYYISHPFASKHHGYVCRSEMCIAKYIQYNVYAIKP